MRGNGYDVSHKKTNYSSIETNDNAYIDLEEGDDKAEEDHRQIIENKSFSFCWLTFELINNLFSCEKAKDGHNW